MINFNIFLLNLYWIAYIKQTIIIKLFLLNNLYIINKDTLQHNIYWCPNNKYLFLI